MLNKPVAVDRNTRDLTETSGKVVYSQLRNKSLFNPQVHNNQHIEVFNKIITQEIEKMKIRKISDPTTIKNGIKELEENKRIVIRPADKGGAIVILSKEYYNEELQGQLNDSNTYIKLKRKPHKKRVQKGTTGNN